MGADDWALVVGIEVYPGLGDAAGAEDDARAFYEWLIDPAGGDVPAGEQAQATLIVTSQFAPAEDPPRFPSADVAQPTVMQILSAAHRLLNLGRDTGHVGRRLYLYFAGHGVAPQEWQTALLMANAEEGCTGSMYHWLGEYTAEYFRQAGYFDEILLFMDCCRDIRSIQAPNMPWGPLRAGDFPERVRRFYAFATRWSQRAWGRPVIGGGLRGEFTTALLAGLRGDAAEPHSGGEITCASLKHYLISKLRTLLDSDFKADDFVIARVPVRAYPVVIHLPPQTAGMQAQIRVAHDGRFEVLKETRADPPTWTLELEAGVYEVQVLAAALQQAFAVDGTGGVDVQLA